MTEPPDDGRSDLVAFGGSVSFADTAAF